MTSKWNLCWVLPWMLSTWGAVELLVFLPLFLAGLIVFPIAEAWIPIVVTNSRVWDRAILAFKWRWVDIWLGNDEDGLRGAAGGKTFDAYLWFIRNPVSNMRFWPLISIKPHEWLPGHHGVYRELPAPLWVWGNAAEVAETPGWFVCRCGWYVGVRWIWAKPILSIKGIWIGWKLNPRDAKGIPFNDYRKAGIGLCCQILRA